METVTLQSNDGEIFTVSEETAKLFGTLKNLLEVSTSGTVPLPEVNSQNLRKILQFANASANERETFFQDFTRSMLLELINATNYLEYRELLDLTMNEVVKNIKGKTPQQIREYFGIESDFTPEEEEQVRKENQWLEE